MSQDSIKAPNNPKSLLFREGTVKHQFAEVLRKSSLTPTSENQRAAYG